MLNRTERLFCRINVEVELYRADYDGECPSLWLSPADFDLLKEYACQYLCADYVKSPIGNLPNAGIIFGVPVKANKDVADGTFMISRVVAYE